MSKNHKTKIHINVNGQLFQINKRFSDMKQRQKEKINEWLYTEFSRVYIRNGKMLDKSDDAEIIFNVCEKIEKAQMWLPEQEVRKHYFKRKAKFMNRCERSLKAEDSSNDSL